MYKVSPRVGSDLACKGLKMSLVVKKVIFSLCSFFCFRSSFSPSPPHMASYELIRTSGKHWSLCDFSSSRHCVRYFEIGNKSNFFPSRTPFVLLSENSLFSMNGVSEACPNGLPLHKIGLFLCRCGQFSKGLWFSTQEALVFAMRDKMFVASSLSEKPSKLECTDRVSSTTQALDDVV